MSHDALQHDPPSVEEMLSFNTLTPHYEEDVVYALNAASVGKYLKAGAEASLLACVGRQGCVGKGHKGGMLYAPDTASMVV